MDESTSDEIEENDSDAYEDDSNSDDDAPIKEHCIGENNVNKSTNGYDGSSSFDADATLPPSPSDKITMNGTAERFVFLSVCCRIKIS